MKRTSRLSGICIPLLLLLIFVCFPTVYASDHALTLWYDEPANEWTEALPIGNGRLGAMVFGGVKKERVQFNEDTLWTGVPRDYINPKAKETLPKVRQLLFEGKQREAERVANDMMSIPLRQEMYQPFGDVWIEMNGIETYGHYKRELDLNTAIATTTFQSDGVTYTREVFSSYPDQVIVIRITADTPQSIDCVIRKTSPHENHTVRNEIYGSDGMIVLRGQAGEYYDQAESVQKPSVLKFESKLKIESTDGKTGLDQEGIAIREASEIVVTLSAHTSYKTFRDIGNNPTELNNGILLNTETVSYEKLKERHIDDYQTLFHRLAGNFGEGKLDETTDLRIKNFNGTNDKQLVELYMQYGRYLLIASSRPGSQPANLQGIWNQEMKPPWESKWTVNINTEMNYWIAEMGNLAECHEPLIAMLQDLRVTGANVAQEHYGCRGWVLHHNTDIWRGAAPINASNHGIWMTGGAWLCQHLWWHYAYSLDEDYLRDIAYPTMKEAALFFVDFLIEDPETGWLISTPSNSPEIGGLVAGPSMDHQIIRNLFRNCIEASGILGVDSDLRTIWKTKIKQIAPNQIGKHGQLQEWLEDKDDPDNKHRHISHLFALHPGNEISPLTSPKLAEACKVTLSHRGDGGTGWSKAWKVNFWARLFDGNHAYKMFTGLIDKSTLPNLFDTHPPFQIDGNFGGASGILEMIVQSHLGEIHLLPALPDALSDGWINGIRARGGFEVDISWKEGELVQVSIHSKAGEKLKVRYEDEVINMNTEPGMTYGFDDELSLMN